MDDQKLKSRRLKPLPSIIFMSRWLQLPLYLGLILAQAVYVFMFWSELYYLILSALGNETALQHILRSAKCESSFVKQKPQAQHLRLIPKTAPTPSLSLVISCATYPSPIERTLVCCIFPHTPHSLIFQNSPASAWRAA